MSFDWREFLAFAQYTAVLTGVGFSLEASQRLLLVVLIMPLSATHANML